ncbi:MAG: hypothetical protein Q8L71_13295 [Thiobacillus sp.]|nr:hypothetical protein [Thiobacillus sp.]
MKHLSVFTAGHANTGANMANRKIVNGVMDIVGGCHSKYLEAIDG